MLEITNNEINAFHGLSGDDDGKVARDPNATGGTSGDGNGWTTAQNIIDSTGNLLNAGANFANSLHSNNTGSNYNGGYNYNNYNPGTTNVKQSNTMDYLPWILGGLGAILLIGLIIKK